MGSRIGKVVCVWKAKWDELIFEGDLKSKDILWNNLDTEVWILKTNKCERKGA